MADKVYVVNHTLLSTGHQAGEAFVVNGGKVTNVNTGAADDVDVDRLSGLFAIRDATPEEIEAFKDTGLADPNAILQGDAPEGQTRVSSDTFAAVAPNQVRPAGGNQSDRGKGKKADASNESGGVNDTGGGYGDGGNG